MTTYLERAIRRGINSTEVIGVTQRVSAAGSPNESPNAVVAPRRSLSRRIARRVLRLMRPALAPLLLRLQYRIQTAIDTSPEILQIQNRVDAIQTGLNDISATLNEALLFYGSVSAMERQFDTIAEKLSS